MMVQLIHLQTVFLGSCYCKVKIWTVYFQGIQR